MPHPAVIEEPRCINISLVICCVVDARPVTCVRVCAGIRSVLYCNGDLWDYYYAEIRHYGLCDKFWTRKMISTGYLEQGVGAQDAVVFWQEVKAGRVQVLCYRCITSSLAQYLGNNFVTFTSPCSSGFE